jgi:tRNA modification GTPase
LLTLSAQVESVLDFGGEDDVSELSTRFSHDLSRLAAELADALEAPAAEMLREGYRVALAGPPNAGKSTLFNALVDSEAAITASIPGTTRDVLTRPVALGGIPFLFVDMAGLRDDGADEIEAVGIARAQAEIERADLVLWLGPEGAGPQACWDMEAQCDRPDHPTKNFPAYRVSAVTGDGLDTLKRGLIAHARQAMPGPGEAALSSRQRRLLTVARDALIAAQDEEDLLCLAEALRQARLGFDRLVGRSSTEDVLDALFGRFCIGK